MTSHPETLNFRNPTGVKITFAVSLAIWAGILSIIFA